VDNPVNQRFYLDYCATTPVHPDVRLAMKATLDDDFGNPSSMHWAGRRAAELIQISRQNTASGIGCQSDEVHFTSGATESNNLALFGILHQFAPKNAHLITSAVEHHAILHAAEKLAQEGYSVTLLPVDRTGRVDPEQVRKAIRPDTKLVSIMLVNNEVGAIQPVAEIGRMAHETGVLMHTDAVQGMGLPGWNVDSLNVDLLSLSGHKIYGPKGIGVLYVRSGIELQPQIYGGPQEGSIRAGTENVPGIAGMGAAMQLVCEHRQEQQMRLASLRAQVIDQLAQRIPGMIVNGPEKQVAPHVLSISFPGADGEMMLLRLNNKGIAVSLGSACTTKSIEPSHVLSAMGLPIEQVEGTLRISMGFPTIQDDLDWLIAVLPEVVKLSRR